MKKHFLNRVLVLIWTFCILASLPFWWIISFCHPPIFPSVIIHLSSLATCYFPSLPLPNRCFQAVVSAKGNRPPNWNPQRSVGLYLSNFCWSHKQEALCLVFPLFLWAIDQFQIVTASEDLAGLPCLLLCVDDRYFLVFGTESLLPDAIIRQDNLDFDSSADDAQLYLLLPADVAIIALELSKSPTRALWWTSMKLLTVMSAGFLVWIWFSDHFSVSLNISCQKQ